MRVLTYNIHGWKGLDGRVDLERLARIISASDADIVGLNEVFHPFVPESDGRVALDWLAGTLGMDIAFGVALTPQFAFAPLAAYGNALLTRYSLLAHAGHHLTPVENHEQRGLLEARILLPDGRSTLSVYVTHLDHRSEQVRLRQLAALLQWTVRDRERPHLVLGDFNALAPSDFQGREQELEGLRAFPETAHLVDDGTLVVPRALKARYRDSWTDQGEGPGPTFPSAEPRIRIDYIFCSVALAPALRSCRRWQTPDTAQASDHLPVLAEFDLTVMEGGKSHAF